ILRYLGDGIGVLKCPMGVPERQAWTAQAGPPVTFPPYPFSYSVNSVITGETGAPDSWPSRGKWPVPLAQIRRSSQTVLALEEDVCGIDDGSCALHSARFVE